VFLTALFGGCSSLFALSYALDAQIGIIAFFAFLWGLFVFLFDRTLSIAPILTPDFSLSGNKRIRKPRIAWILLLLRVAVAILLALFISTPLELKIFQSEIEAVIVKADAETKSGEINLAILDLDKQRLAEMANQEKSLEPLQKDTPEETALKAQRMLLNEKYAFKIREREREFRGESGSGTKGYGSRALLITRELEALDKETKEVSERLRMLTEKRGQEIAAFRADRHGVQDKLIYLMKVLRERQSYLDNIVTEDAKKDELERLNREQAISATNGVSDSIAQESVKAIQAKIEALKGMMWLH
jgi:hypothetical protein